jgi:hypothetical protein
VLYVQDARVGINGRLVNGNGSLYTHMNGVSGMRTLLRKQGHDIFML